MDSNDKKETPAGDLLLIGGLMLGTYGAVLAILVLLVAALCKYLVF